MYLPFLSDYYENIRGYSDVRLYPYYLFLVTRLYWKKTLKTIRFNTYEEMILRKPLVDGTYLCCKTFHGGL